jgi:hypothetical protein
MESEDPASLPWEEFDALLATVEALRSEDRIEPEEYLIVRHSRAVCALIVLMSSADEAADEARARFRPRTRLCSRRRRNSRCSAGRHPPRRCAPMCC